MTKKQAYILAGVAVAVLAFGYLATKRDVNATITEGIATVTYHAGLGAAAAPTPTEDPHQRMADLIDESNAAIAADTTLDATVVQ